MDASNSYILFLPEIALEKIFSFLTFDEIAKNRIVCKKFNQVGSNLLCRSFIQLEKRHATIYKRVKSALPRRESERRAHPLSRHSDILQAVETRISMLNMTYTKYIENKLTCFIPGKVLDELRHVLNLTECDHPPRTHQLLQELRDLSSMAMEHFDEHILPRVKDQLEKRQGSPEKMLKELEVVAGSFVRYSRSRAFFCPAPASTSKASQILLQQQVQQVLSTELHKVKKQSKNQKHHISYLTQSTHKLGLKLRKQNVRLKAQSIKIREQERKIQEQNTKIQEQEATLADIKKHIDEWDQKYKDLTAELVRARDEILMKTSPAVQKPTISTQTNSTPKIYKSNIKPRMAHILPKSYLSFDVDRKRKSNLLPEIPLKRNKSSSKSPICEEVKNNKNSVEDIELNIPNLSNFKEPPDQDLMQDVSGENEFENNISFITTSIGTSIDKLLNTDVTNIKSRKRKMPEDIDLK